VRDIKASRVLDMLCFYVQLVLDGLMAGALPLGSKFLRSVDLTEPEVLNDYQSRQLEKVPCRL
jgi:hypothetical protein